MSFPSSPSWTARRIGSGSTRHMSCCGQGMWMKCASNASGASFRTKYGTR